MKRVLICLLLLCATAAAEEPWAERSFSEVLEALEHPNPAVRVEAERELMRRGDKRALAPLIKRLKDSDSSVRAYAVEALRSLKDERAVPPLSKALEDTDPTVRARALLALGELGGKYVIPSVSRSLKDPVSMVRAAAIRALGEIGDPLSLARILKAQKEEEEDVDFAVTASAVIAAAKIGGAEGLDASYALARKKMRESWFVRASVAHAVGLAGVADQLELVLVLFREDPDSRVVQASAGALAVLGQKKVLLEGITSPEAHRRRAAVGGLLRVEGQDVTRALVRATKDKEQAVSLEAGSVLLGRGYKDAFPVLISLLEGDGATWLAAVAILESRTGLDYGRNPPRWSEWFRERRDRLVFDPKTGRYQEGS